MVWRSEKAEQKRGKPERRFLKEGMRVISEMETDPQW